jgi:cytochrome P450 family 142 subfamily A polypeptide 1
VIGPLVNLLSPDLYADDPEPTYRWLRDNAPAYFDEANHIWGISRYADVLAIERDCVRFSSGRGSRPHIEMTDSMINKDDPLHQAQRRLVARRFTPSAVRVHDPEVRRMVTQLIDSVCEQGRCEVVRDLAAPLPAMVIAELLGFGKTRWRDCQRWSEVTMSAAGFELDDPRRPAGSPEAVAEFAEAALDLVKLRRTTPADDLISVWANASVGGEPLSDGEIVQEALLLLDGGAETTRSVIGQSVLALDRNPDQRKLLLEDLSLLGRGAVEEMIRWATPILNMRRSATTDSVLHGQRISTGDEVLLLYGSANRDERAFDDPQRFDIARQPNHHVAFGYGTHFCLGAHLARLEIRVLFEELLGRLPDLHVVEPYEPRFAPGYFTRTLVDLPAEFTPSRRVI